MATIIQALVGIGIFVGCIAAFGGWGILVFIGAYIVLGALAQRANPGKREDKYGNWR